MEGPPPGGPSLVRAREPALARRAGTGRVRRSNRSAYSSRTSPQPVRASHEREPRWRISRAHLVGRVVDALASGGLLVTAGAGYGKTTVLEQALGERSPPAAWISCTATERAPETLLKRILDALALAAPGASEALTERLALAPEQVDALAATRALLADLPQLLVDPVTLVIDDGEHLDGAEGSLALISELFRAESRSLRLALASRRSLDLRVAKPRATGHLVDLTAADLAFEAEECAALLRAQGGRDASPEDVETVIKATEGWPLGVVVAVRAVCRMQDEGDRIELRGLRSAPDLRAYLCEELLDSLEPELREGAIESSVTRVVTTAVAGALGLPTDFGRRIQLAGVLVRRIDEDDAFAYHPLLRELLLERLEVERGAAQRRRLHAAVAPVIAAAGDPIEATEHWLAARSWPDAVAAIEREGPILVRTSAGLLRRWLSLLPAADRELPTIRSLEGQLEWGAGDHPRAAEILADALRGFGASPNPPAEWFARFVLADSLFSIGRLDELRAPIDGWDRPAAEAAGIMAPATAIYVAVAFATIGRFDESDRLAARALAHPDADLLGPVEALRIAFRETPPGHLERALAGIEAAVAQLEGSDPFNLRLYFLATLAFMYTERGRDEEALEIWTRVREGARGGSGPFLADTVHAWGRGAARPRGAPGGGRGRAGPVQGAGGELADLDRGPGQGVRRLAARGRDRDGRLRFPPGLSFRLDNRTPTALLRFDALGKCRIVATGADCTI